MPRIWRGETVAVIGGGPSLTAVDVGRLEGKCRVICVNNAYQLAPWADWLHAADMLWWMAHRDRGALHFAGIKTTTCDTVLPHLWDVKYLHPSGETGFDDDPSCVRHGANSAYAAVHIAAHAGAARILLLGLDMRPSDDGALHWHADHSFNINRPDFARMRANFDGLAPELRRRGVDVLNCTIDSALTAFPMASLDVALA